MPDTTQLAPTTGAPPAAGRSPREVLEGAAAELEYATGGLVVGKLWTSKDDDSTMIRLRAVAPAVGEGSWSVLTVIYPNASDYPAWVHAEHFPRSLNVGPYALLTPVQEEEDFVAHDAEGLRRLVDAVLGSPPIEPLLGRLAANARAALAQSGNAT